MIYDLVSSLFPPFVLLHLFYYTYTIQLQTDQLATQQIVVLDIFGWIVMTSLGLSAELEKIMLNGLKQKKNLFLYAILTDLTGGTGPWVFGDSK